MLFALLSLTASAHPDIESCDRTFMERIFPDGPPGHRPPPMRPLLEFAWDLDDSGDLDASEQATLKRDTELRCASLEAIANDLDTDGDGAISATERDEGLHALFGPPPPHHRDGRKGPPRGERPDRKPGMLPPPLMRAFDTDGDRSLSDAEKKSARTDVQDRFRNGLPLVPPPERR